jgi:hypothetical protein
MSNTQQLQPAVQPKAPVAIGKRGIELTSLDELYRFAVYISKSGFAPKGMDAPEAIVVAIEMGLELGLTPMQSVQNIAVINGRPSVWGDVPLALARASGVMEIFEEYYEQDGKRLDRAPSVISDGTAAVCRLKRVNQAPHSQSFSVADAKRAGLWGKQGPWTQYPLRMLQMRARGFALRDQLGDFLKGLITREEAQDIPEDPVRRARNVTPPKDPAPEIPATTTNPEPEPEKEGDDVPMEFTTPAPAAQQTEPVASTPAQASTSPVNSIAIACESTGTAFEVFLKWAIESGNLVMGAGPRPTSFETLPADFVKRFAGRERVLVKALATYGKGGQ